MLTPVAMRKINVFVEKQDVENATAVLAEQECLHLAEPREEEWQEEITCWSDLAAKLEDRKHRIADVLHTLGLEPRTGQPPRRLSPTEDIEDLDQALREVETEVHRWQEEKSDNEAGIADLTHLQREMYLLSDLDLSISEIRNPEYLHWTVGTLPVSSLENLEFVLYRVPFVIVPVQIRENRALIVAVSSQRYGAMLERALRGVFFEKLEIPEDVEGRPSKILPQIEKRLDEAKRQRRELEKRREKLVDNWQHRLFALWREASNNLAVAKTITRYDRHGDIFLIAGWVPQEKVDEILVSLENVTGGQADVEIIEPIRGGRRVVPTKLRNPRIVRPFQFIVSTFGFPDYGEIDPTILVAISFTIMYGMMFGDVGHGAMLGIFGAWLLMRRKAGRVAANLGGILIAAAVSSMVFGILYGSVFGKEKLLPHLWLTPLEGIQELLIVSVLGGIVLINCGFILNLVRACRAHDWGALLFEQSGIAGICLYWALVGGGYALFKHQLSAGMLAGLIIVPAVILYCRAPLRCLVNGEHPVPEEGWGAYAVQAFFELLEIFIRYLSNTLSFVRLGAFAVAHAAFMGVVFALAQATPGIFQWSIIIIGTILVVGLEGLIVGIQALRLDYYEFFGRFYSGRGTAFTPLRLPHDTAASET